MRVRTVLVGLVGAAYVAGCHWLMTSAPASRWNAVVVIGPMLGLLALFAARRGQRLVAAIAALALAGLVLQAWLGGGLAPATLYLAQHVAIHGALAALFGADPAARPGAAGDGAGAARPRQPDAGHGSLFAQGDDRLERATSC